MKKKEKTPISARIPLWQHKAAVSESVKEDLSLNNFLVKTIDEFIKGGMVVTKPMNSDGGFHHQYIHIDVDLIAKLKKSSEKTGRNVSSIIRLALNEKLGK